MPEYARVCHTMPDYARVCQSMPEYARVCQSMPEYARVCQSMPDYARLCQDMQEYVRVCQIMPEYARECQSLPEYARVCQSMPEYARVCQRLPELLTLRDPLTGEPRIFHKRTFPRALRFFKKKVEKNAHHFYFTELILFKPFFDENEFFPEDPERCEAIYHEHKRELQMVKAQAMPFLESVEEAQQIYEEMRREEANIEERMGADLDPQMEQEAADNDDEDEFDV